MSHDGTGETEESDGEGNDALKHEGNFDVGGKDRGEGSYNLCSNS